MSFDKVKSFLEELNKVGLYYRKQKKLTWIFSYLVTIVITFIVLSDLFINIILTPVVNINKFILISFLIFNFSISIIISNFILLIKENLSNNESFKKLHEINTYYFENKTFISIYFLAIILIPAIYISNLIGNMNIIWGFFAFTILFALFIYFSTYIMYIENKFLNKNFLKNKKRILIVSCLIFSMFYIFIFNKYNLYEHLIPEFK